MMETNESLTVFDPSKAYLNFFACHRRYKIIKGSRASKKSTMIAGYVLLKILKSSYSNVICLRKYYTDVSRSVYNQLKISARLLKIYDKFIWKQNPMMVIKKGSSQAVYFQGLKSPDSLTSIQCAEGVFDTVWLEEAFEITNKEDWLKVEGSFRGPKKLEFILSFNPWKKNWIYDRWFKGILEDDEEELEKKGYQEYVGKNILLLITNHRLNQFITDADHYAYIGTKKFDVAYYKVASLGCWGTIDAMVYNTISEDNFISREELLNKEKWTHGYIGVDFGLIHDATFATLTLFNRQKCKLATVEEWYHSNKGKRNKMSYTDIVESTVDFTRQCLMKYPAFLNTRRVYVENQSEGFRQILNSVARTRGVNVSFLRCKKELITTRVAVFRHMLAYKQYLIANECPVVGEQFRTSMYDLKKLKEQGRFERSAENDDALASVEYSTTGIWKYLLRNFEGGGIYEED